MFKMRYIKIVTIALILFGCIAPVSAKKKTENKVYMYGISFSLKDSVVYLTDIQQVDSAVVEGKYNYLYGRADYSYQLRNFMRDKLNRNYTTNVVISDVTKEGIDKRYLKTRKHFTYVGKGKKQRRASYDLRYIGSSEFRFEHVLYDVEKPQVQTKEERKAAKAKAKEERKKQKAALKGATKGGGSKSSAK